MIPLFLKIYQNKKLCPLLLKYFKETVVNSKFNNSDRKTYSKDYTSQFNNIVSEVANIRRENKYDPIDFYGIILCYLNYYDEENFFKFPNWLYADKPEYLYEIMLRYATHFRNPINLYFEFFNKFISYSIKKIIFLFFKLD